MKTSELTGAALDWAVAKCEVAEPVGSFLDGVVPHPDYNNFHPSTDWAQAGEIIEREEIGFQRMESGLYQAWKRTCIEYAVWPEDSSYAEGPTALIAAMRCYVASRLGNEIEVPGELK